MHLEGILRGAEGNPLAGRGQVDCSTKECGQTEPESASVSGRGRGDQLSRGELS